MFVLDAHLDVGGDGALLCLYEGGRYRALVPTSKYSDGKSQCF